ncbi:hypothetical protein GYMLUDRAFT_258739 [Collybiopsis luxurians FD-317 M1]|nr:hypothetical protein GYMLUDRAFT_258739 [Collybiopsis luxurians FD-317 M1]
MPPSSDPPQIHPAFRDPARVKVFIASVLVVWSAGTTLIFSIYGQQLGTKLGLNHVQLNLIALGGNVGIYVSGRLWSRTVKSTGLKFALISAFALLFVGYFGICLIYNIGLPKNSKLVVALLIACRFATGTGANAGYIAAINTTMKIFPYELRGSTSVLLADVFKLSSFLFSIAGLCFPGNTSLLLLLLALGTSFPMLIGLAFIQPDSLPAEAEDDLNEGNGAEADAASFSPYVISATSTAYDTRRSRLLVEEERLEDGMEPRQMPTTVAEDRLSSPPPSFSQSKKIARPNVYGAKLWSSIDFWLLFISMSLLSGTCLMYIYNVGFMAQALYVFENINNYTENNVAQKQAMEVSIISYMNFVGFNIIIALSKFVTSRLNLPQSTMLVLVASILLSSQIAAFYINDVTILWTASALLGLGNGSMFILYTMLCAEGFGLPHLSENWTYLSFSSILGGTLFSVAFGRNLDTHFERWSNESTLSHMHLSSEIPAGQCLKGLECYVDSLRLSIWACSGALGLSVWAAWRDQRKAEELGNWRDRMDERPLVANWEQGENEGER